MLLGTLVATGNDHDKPLNAKNDCGGESRERERQEHVKTDRSPASTLRENNEESRLSSREHFETSFKAVGLECLFPFFVVVRIVRVEPIALGDPR